MDQITVKFSSKSVNESFSRMIVSAFAMRFDPTIEELSELKTAVSEAVTNAIVHAYTYKTGYITMKLSASEDNVIKIIIKDTGSGIENIDLARTPCFSTGSEDRAGMGFTIMESFTDKLRIKSAPGKGTTIIMEKRIVKRK